VLRIFGLNRDEVIGWRKKCIMRRSITWTLCQVKENVMGTAFGMHWGEEECIKILMGKPEGKRLGRLRCRWRIILKRILERMVWYGLG
jgi:hypothetical protein